ncbi:MAG: putative 2OG-Fe(II) oxygenase [Pseudomonadota bacterium]
MIGVPDIRLDRQLRPCKEIIPKPGMLALFPSFSWHGTVPFEAHNPRMTVAFDVVPT